MRSNESAMVGSVCETLDGDALSSQDPSLHNGLLTFQRVNPNTSGMRDLYDGATEDITESADFYGSEDEDMTEEDRML